MKRQSYYSRRNKRKKRFIVHVDMDAFFASIEQRDNPQFRARPVIVGADPKGGSGRGVVSTCSYEARRFGIHSAMPISIAYRKCPHAVFLPVDMEKYGRVSTEICDILYSFTPDIEPISIDEAFLDITGSYHLFGTPLETCLAIKSRIKVETSLEASLGLAPTKMAAKIASDLKKPNGMVEVTDEKLLEFLRPLEIRRLWGLGEHAEKILNGMGIMTIGELAARPPEEIAKALGKCGAHFWELANGIDEAAVETTSETKSISNEITFASDTLDKDKVEAKVMSLCESVAGRLRGQFLKCRTITLKIRLAGFHTFTRSFTMPEMTSCTNVLYKETKSLYNNFDAGGKKIRLIGVRLSNMSRAHFKESLFTDPVEEKEKAIDRAFDAIKDKFGDSSIYRATSYEGKNK